MKKERKRGRLKCKYKNGNGEENLKQKKNWMKQ